MRRAGTLALVAAAATVLLGACGSTSVPQSMGEGGQPADAGACPARRAAPDLLRNVTADHRNASYWVARFDDADAELLSAAEIADHNAALAHHDRANPGDDPLARYDLTAPENTRRLKKDVLERLAFMRDRITDARYVSPDGSRLAPEAIIPFAIATADRVALEGSALATFRARQDIPLRCGPRDAPLYKGPVVDVAFDRNSCSTIRQGELVRVIADWGGGLRLARTSYAMGWIGAGAPLSGALSAADVKTQARTRTRSMTRRAVFEKAFSYLGKPYGWGGQAGGRDCSRFVMDVFASFGLQLPRHSGLQAKAGDMSIDLSNATSGSELSAAERLGLIDAANERGIVLLHFPGHIMLYLGRSQEGTPMAIHAFAEYLEKCEQGGESLRLVDRIQVSDLSLGEHTSRRSFLQRVTRITVLGGTPGAKLLGAVERRPAAPMASPPTDCADSEDVAIFVSPRRPHVGAPVRVIVTSNDDLGAAEIRLTDPTGQHHVPALHTNGGPPFGYWTEVATPSATGAWTAQVGDGSRVAACETFTVHKKGDVRQGNGGSVWRPRRAWKPSTENLFATFVEQLFAYPLDDRTWNNLQGLLGNKQNNLLFDHLGQAEDEALHLRPDCADLPHFLRAYFSWKMRLPFAYRHCNRGSKGKAPYCDRDLHDPLSGVDAATEVGAFGLFARDNIANGVHSGSGRAEIQSDHTDYYPLPLTREAIRPGTIFADPYGHLFVIADWVPQGVGTYGILIGADAQPDGTIGRRRFWPGSFLFSPDTSESAAGFKGFRPVRYRGGRVRQLKNKDIRTYSREQYAGSAQDFYDKIEALINPRPLDPSAMLDVLVAALFEQVKRRVVSVQNAVDFRAGRSGAIKMPRGHAIFETTGAWEDFSTPSRDMRLLIAMDTVLGFPAAVQRNPKRFGVVAPPEQVVAALRRALDASLAKHSFSYANTDGAAVVLTLKEVVARSQALEMSYNPNDCIEVRWAAPASSPERASCRARAPQHQLARMTRYRDWFAKRKRPPR